MAASEMKKSSAAASYETGRTNGIVDPVLVTALGSLLVISSRAQGQVAHSQQVRFA
jgi:hypothetical protein